MSARSPIGPALLVALAGRLVLGQNLAITGYFAIVLVTLASIGAVRTASGRRSPPASLPWAQASP